MRMCVFVLAGAACLSVAGGQVQPSGAESPKPAGAQGADSASGPQVTEGVVNAPIAEVWRVFSTSEGFKKLGVAKCEMDLRIGGLIRTHYNPEGVIGDAGTIENEILALEPGRMLAFRIHKPPATFPFSQETWSKTWTVASLTDLGDQRTHVRLAGMGYDQTEESRKMRAFFESGNAWVMQKLKSQYDGAAGNPQGPAHPPSTLAAFTHERLIDLPREAVWKMFSTSGGWKENLGVESQIELRPGGKFEIYFSMEPPAGQRGSEGCTVLSYVPGEMLSFTWNAPPKFTHARELRTWVVMRFDEVSPTRTRVSITHQGFAEQAQEHTDHKAEWEQVREYFHAAWQRVLDAASAHGTATDAPSAADAK